VPGPDERDDTITERVRDISRAWFTNHPDAKVTVTFAVTEIEGVAFSGYMAGYREGYQHGQMTAFEDFTIEPQMRPVREDPADPHDPLCPSEPTPEAADFACTECATIRAIRDDQYRRDYGIPIPTHDEADPGAEE